MKQCIRLLNLCWISCLILACQSDSRRTKVVENRQPTPDFVVPDRVPGRGYVCFLAIGDQGTGSSGQKQTAALMNEKARVDSADFVITLGDNFYSYGVTSVHDQQWRDKFEVMYDLPNLQIPFYATLGNHDRRQGNGHFQVEYSKTSPKWHMPNDYYTFTRAIDSQSSIQFFALDTDAIVQEEAAYLAQIEWLEQQLQASTATWKIVYGHHPVFSYGKHGNEKQMIAYVRPLLEKYDVDIYICGHDHDRQFLEPIGGVHYLVCGTGAKSRDTRYGETTIFAETNLGFSWFRVSANEFHFQFINGDGEIEYAQTWTKGAVTKRPYETFEVVGRFDDAFFPDNF